VSVSFVLRLVPEALAASRIVGRIEVVETGEQVTVRDARDLIEFLCAQGRSVDVQQGGGMEQLTEIAIESVEPGR